jgi:hypothetical protein
VPPLLSVSLALSGWVERKRFERAVRDPARAQAALLRSLLHGNRDTAFGRAHGFATAAGAREYARRVPIRDYEGFRPYVARLAAGEARVLTAERPLMFATTSGTTGEPKLVPVTPTSRAATAALMRLWLARALADHPGLFRGRLLTVVSPALECRTPAGIPCGAMSGAVARDLPWVARRHQAVPYQVSLIPDPEARYFVTMRLALAHPVSSVGTPNATTLIRLAETARAHGEAIVRAIHDGTLGIPEPALGEDPALEGADAGARLGAALCRDPARARVLARAIEERGSLTPRAAWPGLALVGCWLGGNAGIHARRLGDHYGPAPLRDLGLIASEGRLTVPLEDGSPAGVLAVHAGFFEFVPEDRIEDAAPPVLLAHELVEGQRYYVVLTGANGLYRYDLNDVVEVRGFYHRTPQVAFVRKGRDMVSITGEKLHLNQIQAAIREAEEASAVEVWQFRLIPDVAACRYDLLVERRGAWGDDHAGLAFIGAFDAALSRLNVEYAAKRASRRLERPSLALMRAGWAERQCRADFARGKREVQYKWPAIAPDWDPASREDVVHRLEAVSSPGGEVVPASQARTRPAYPTTRA